MRIKFNDKIYRLKEIESGVDSLMELVEEPKHKHGDFLMNDYRFAFILDREGGDGEAYCLFCTDMDGEIQSHMQDREKGVRYCDYLKHAVLADSEATEAIHYGLKSIGKRWNADKKCIEDIPVYNYGDFLVSKGGYPFILDREGRSGESHYLFATSIYDPDVKSIQDSGGKLYCGYLKDASVADQEAIKIIHDGLKSIGKCWNDDKKCVEDIPKRKFKTGDKVRIKDGISSETHRSIAPGFTSTMDKFIGKELTVKEYRGGFALISEDYCGYYFAEDWLEPYTEKLKKGELAIFWDDNKDHAIIRIYNVKGYSQHSDSYGHLWENAIKFESKEQFEKVLRGEI